MSKQPSTTRVARLHARARARALMHQAETNWLRMQDKYGHTHWRTLKADHAYYLRWYAYTYPQFA